MLPLELTAGERVMNAAGMLGFTPPARGTLDTGGWAAFVTNPISLAPRSPAENRACLPFPGGVLLHTGLPNPGLSAVLRQFVPRWAGSPLPVIAHLIPRAPEEAAEMVTRLESVDGLIGLEIGFPPEAEPELVTAIWRAAQGELPILPCLPLDQASAWAPRLQKHGATQAVLAPPRGVLANPAGRLVPGRLYGPALLPQACSAVRQLTAQGWEVIAGGGVYRAGDLQALRQAGAAAVQLDTVLWVGGMEQAEERGRRGE